MHNKVTDCRRKTILDAKTGMRPCASWRSTGLVRGGRRFPPRNSGSSFPILSGLSRWVEGRRRRAVGWSSCVPATRVGEAGQRVLQRLVVETGRSLGLMNHRLRSGAQGVRVRSGEQRKQEPGNLLKKVAAVGDEGLCEKVSTAAEPRYNWKTAAAGSRLVRRRPRTVSRDRRRPRGGHTRRRRT